MEAFLGQKRAATPADPSAALRAFFEVTSPAGTTAPSQQQGKCKGFGHQMTMRSDRMISHFAPNKTGAGSWSSCAKPPAGANELAQQVRDAGKSKAARKEETAAREASFIQKTLPDLFNMSAREATHDAWARFCVGTGQSFGAGSHHLFHDFIRALRHDPHWSPEHRTTISGTRLDKSLSVWEPLCGRGWMRSSRPTGAPYLQMAGRTQRCVYFFCMFCILFRSVSAAVCRTLYVWYTLVCIVCKNVLL